MGAGELPLNGMPRLLTGTCVYCGARIVWSHASLRWYATTWADLNGYCRTSPELEHLPKG
jgi:hypothetical protein